MNTALKPGYKQTEVGVIPEDWNLMPFVRAVGTYIDYRGRTPRKLGLSWGGGDILALSANNVQMGRIDPDKDAYFGSEELYRTWMVQGECERGDVLLTMEAPLGNVAQIPDARKYILSQRVLLIKPKNWLLRDFLAHYMKGAAFQQQLSLNSTGSTAKGIQRRKLDDLPVYLPPTKVEQQAIAEALSDADALIESIEQLLAKKRDVKQASMQKLLTGERRLPGFVGDWEIRRFGDVVIPREERIDSRRGGSQEFCVELEHIGSATGSLLGSASTDSQSSLKTVFRAGDVLFGKLRAYLRKYWWADRPGVCSTEIWVLSSAEGCLASAYLFQLVQTDQFIEIASSAYGTHMPRSDWRMVKNYMLRLPPTIAEQNAVAEILSDMDDEVAAVEGNLAKARQIKQGMMQNLLTGKIRLV